MESKVTINVAEDEPPRKPPPPPPPKRLSRPKITLTIPEKDLPKGLVTAQIPMTPRVAQTGQIYWGPTRYHGNAPITPGSHVSDPAYINPFMHMYHNKASDFMFKQFAGFKDFTMNTAKSGLSAGEKSAFWFYNKLRTLSKKWFTHLFLTLCLVLYSVMGAFMFMALEGTHEEKGHNTTTMNISEIRRDVAMQINVVVKADIQSIPTVDLIEDLLKEFESNYTSYLEHSSGKKIAWGFWNSMFYAGTIYTTIGLAGLCTYSQSEISSHTVMLDIFLPNKLVAFVNLMAAKNVLISKTSETEMSEEQQNVAAETRRKIMPTPRRFMKNRSPRANRSQSVARVEELKVVDAAGTEMTKTSKEIIELMQNRARSLSIPKDDPRLHPAYKHHGKSLQTPQNKTPVSRTSRGISCPKTIQIISEKEILLGLLPRAPKKRDEPPQRPKRSNSGYIDASHSEYTSSCYSSSPSENEYDFDLSERTVELTRKLNLLSQDADERVIKYLTTLEAESEVRPTNEKESVLRKRIVTEKNGVKKEITDSIQKTDSKVEVVEKKKPVKSKWKFMANWQQFKEEQKFNYQKLIFLRNRCLCDLLFMIILFGLGGLMFKTLEGSFENAYKCGTRGVKRDFIESLWRGSHYMREEDWKSLARKKLYEFEEQLHTAHEAGVTSYSGQRSWNFMNSFVYCMTIVTTIGYGHIYPITTYGRVATIVYAIIGIPLFLIVLADFGKLFTRIIKFFWAYIRRFYYTRSCKKVRRTVPMQEMMKGLNIVYDVVRRPSQIFSEEDLQGDGDAVRPPAIERKPSDAPPPLPPKPGQVIIKETDTEPDTPAPSVFEIDDEFNVPISVALVILVVYIIIGATVYNIWENWGFFESFYFVFISMSTIGLGDLVPAHPIFMMASILYLVFGLALTSMCINVVQVKLSDTFTKASAKLGATIGLKVAEEDGSLVPITPPPTEEVPVHKPKSEKEDVKSKEVEEEDKTKS